MVSSLTERTKLEVAAEQPSKLDSATQLAPPVAKKSIAKISKLPVTQLAPLAAKKSTVTNSSTQLAPPVAKKSTGAKNTKNVVGVKPAVNIPQTHKLSTIMEVDEYDDLDQKLSVDDDYHQSDELEDDGLDSELEDGLDSESEDRLDGKSEDGLDGNSDQPGNNIAVKPSKPKAVKKVQVQVKMFETLSKCLLHFYCHLLILVTAIRFEIPYQNQFQHTDIHQGI